MPHVLLHLRHGDKNCELFQSKEISSNGSWYLKNAGNDVVNSSYHEGCTCTCDACKNCDHRSPDWSFIN